MDQSEKDSVGGGNVEPLPAATGNSDVCRDCGQNRQLHTHTGAGYQCPKQPEPLPAVYNPRRARRETVEALVTWACRGGTTEELAPLVDRIRQECLLGWKPSTVGNVEVPVLDDSSVRPLSDVELRAIAVELTERAEALGALASIVILGTSRQPFELSLWAQHKGPGLAVIGLLNSGVPVLQHSLQTPAKPPATP